MSTSLYHETQKLGHCAVHALNNLFQEQWVTYDEMCGHARTLHASDSHPDSCFPLSVNPYKSCIPYMGFFDISVIVKAMESKKCRFSAHTTSEVGVDSLELPGKCVGFIVNVQQPSLLGLSGRHWFSVLKRLNTGETGGIDADESSRYSYWNLDSKLGEPEQYRCGDELKDFLRELVQHSGGHIFTVLAVEEEDAGHNMRESIVHIER